MSATLRYTVYLKFWSNLIAVETGGFHYMSSTRESSTIKSSKWKFGKFMILNWKRVTKVYYKKKSRISFQPNWKKIQLVTSKSL